MAHFKDRFNQHTDVIYGTGLWIHIYIYNYYFGWPTSAPIGKLDINMNLPKGTFDPYMSKAHDKYGNNVINRYNEPIHSKSFPVDKATKTVGTAALKPVATTYDTTTQDLAQSYIDALKACKHLGTDSIEGAITDRMIRALGKYEKMQAINFKKAQFNAKETGRISNHLYDVCIRRSCKYGVFYFTHVKSATLHYILDEMDMNTIVNKTMLMNETAGGKKVPICTSELRYMFRHWNSLKDKSVLFYDGYRTCEAPWYDTRWKSTRADWADYAIARVAKYRSSIAATMGNSSLLSEFDRLAKFFDLARTPVTARKIIESFHALPANLTNHPADDTIST